MQPGIKKKKNQKTPRCFSYVLWWGDAALRMVEVSLSSWKGEYVFFLGPEWDWTQFFSPWKGGTWRQHPSSSLVLRQALVPPGRHLAMSVFVCHSWSGCYGHQAVHRTVPTQEWSSPNSDGARLEEAGITYLTPALNGPASSALLSPATAGSG